MKKVYFVPVALFVIGLGAGAAGKKPALKAAEAKMAKTCVAEYPELKGKSCHDLSEWVEAEEGGDNAEKFRTTKCYAVHEDWEKAGGHGEKSESGEAHEQH